MKIAATDFDGTINRGGRVSGADMKVFRAWRKAGNLFGIVTGRGSDFIETCKEREIPYDFLVIENGARIYDRNANILYESFIDAESVRMLEEECSKKENIVRYDRYEGKPVHLFYGLFPSDEENLEFCDYLNKKMGDRITAYANGRNLNVATKGEGKANGIANLSRIFSVPPEDIYVFGDDYNDLDMILRYDGYAVLTSKKEVKAAAPHLVFSVGSLLRKVLNGKL